MSKSKTIFIWVDNFLEKSRKVLLNIFTVFILLTISLGFLGGLASMFTGEESVKTKGQILYLEPSGFVVDNAVESNDPFSDYFSTSPSQIELDDLLKIIDNAGKDKNLKAIYLDVDGLGAYWTSAVKIADAIYEARQNGAYIIGVTSGLSTSGYLMASQANELILEKGSYGSIEPFGFSRVRQYQKSLFENLKINMNVYAAGDFKSGPEPFTRDDMSENDKIAWQEFIDPIWSSFKTKMEQGRELEAGSIQSYGDNYADLVINAGGDANRAALAAQLVDQLLTKEEIKSYMNQNYGEADSFDWPDGINEMEYLSTLNTKKNKSKNKIAVINVEGAITTGNISFDIAGSDSIVNNIRTARDDDDVVGIVLRVNSPGGDVYASEMITNALEEFQSTDRPVFSSMGDIAASGGVWVTTTSEEVWAEETTLTGSIGVYSIVPVTTELESWAGINYDGTDLTQAARDGDLRRGMTQQADDLFRLSTENFYDQFVSKVAENRGMAKDDVFPIAGGRIWSGQAALELGLVDKLGDLDATIEAMAEKLELEDYKVITYQNDESFDFELSLLLKVKEKLPMIRNLDFPLGLMKIFESDQRYYALAYCFDCRAITN